MTMGRNEYDQTNMGTYDYTDRLVAGADVYGADNEKIGTVADVGQSYFLVQKGWLFIKDLYLPTSTIAQADSNAVYLSLTKQQAEQIGRDQLPTTGDAWYGTHRTGATMADTGYATDREVGRTVNEGGNTRIPIVEEQQTIDVPVKREEVYVTERAVNRPATEADLNMRDRDIEIPLREQEVVTQKEARVTGEVNVRKEVRRENERVTDTVRREGVRVEDPSNPRVHVENARERDMAGDRYGTDRRDDEGIIDRAKDKMRGTDETMRNR